jgi:hypothetical protein
MVKQTSRVSQRLHRAGMIGNQNRLLSRGDNFYKQLQLTLKPDYMRAALAANV